MGARRLTQEFSVRILTPYAADPQCYLYREYTFLDKWVYTVTPDPVRAMSWPSRESAERVATEFVLLNPQYVGSVEIVTSMRRFVDAAKVRKKA